MDGLAPGDPVTIIPSFYNLKFVNFYSMASFDGIRSEADVRSPSNMIQSFGPMPEFPEPYTYGSFHAASYMARKHSCCGISWTFISRSCLGNLARQHKNSASSSILQANWKRFSRDGVHSTIGALLTPHGLGILHLGH